MNPLSATMENNSKMKNKKTNAKKKNKSTTFLLYLYNNVGQGEQHKGFLLGKFWIFSKFVVKVYNFIMAKFKILLEQNEPSSKVNLWSIPLSFCVNIM
jgi:hypothetical protein